MSFADLQPMLQVPILLLVVAFPLIWVLVCFTPLAKTVLRFIPWTVVPALIAPFVIAEDVVVAVPWFFMGGHMGLDETGRIFLCLSAFVWFLASFSCRSMCENDRGQIRFVVFFLTAMAGNFGLVLAGGMLDYYLFFALMSFAAYGLVVHKGTEEAATAGRVYLVLVMIGEVALFTALIILVNARESFAFRDIAGVDCQPLAIGLLFIGFGVKIGALPLHGWMSPAYQAAPIPAAAVLAGAMVNAGILGWLRFLPPGQVSCPQGAVLFIVAGALAAVYGVVVGLNRSRAGAVLGCSSISQMGLVTVIFGLGLLGHEAGLHAVPVLILYVVHHALAKSSLFFGYNLVEGQDRKLSPLQLAAILLPALALAGLPLTSGAIVKGAFKELAVRLGEPWHGLSIFFLPITAIGTTMLMLHFMCVLRRTGGTGISGRAEGRLIFSVSFIAVAITLWLWPAADDFARHSLVGLKPWYALWPVVAGSLLYFVWCRFFSCEKVEVDDHKQETRLGNFWVTITKRLQEQQQPVLQPGRLVLYLHGLVPMLRRSEKVMGRWKVVGISYVALCLLLLFLLL